MTVKEITKDVERKLKVYAHVLFRCMAGDEDYPFYSMEEQLNELREVYATGGISDRFIAFAIGEGEL